MSYLRKKSLVLVWLTLLVLVFVFSLGWYRFTFVPMLNKGEASQTVVLPSGKGMRYLFQALDAQQRLTYPHTWRFFAYWCADTHHLQEGEYEINDHTSFKQLLQHIKMGQVYMRPFTLVEGWTVALVKSALQKNPYLNHTIESMTDQDLLLALKANETALEGLFFPDTYFYARGESDLVILQQAYQKMQQVLQQAWQNRAADAYYQTPYQALVAASLIERETALQDERPLVSAVIINRLKKGMRLQIDPTVLYGLSAQRGQKLTHDDLKVATPYNTYLNEGLPPTPIALASLSSLHAALHPAEVNYLYFVATGKGGTHHFSSNYADHLEAVKQYTQQQKAKEENAPQLESVDNCSAWVEYGLWPNPFYKSCDRMNGNAK